MQDRCQPDFGSTAVMKTSFSLCLSPGGVKAPVPRSLAAGVEGATGLEARFACRDQLGLAALLCV